MSYNTPEKRLQYNHSLKRKLVVERFRKKHPNYLKIWNQNHPDTRNRYPYLQKWRQTSHGKILFKKTIDKYNSSPKGKLNSKRHATKRLRNLQFIPISENILLEKSVWHHIDDIHVITIPEDLHLLYSSPIRQNHRFMCNQIVDQLYNRG